MIVNPDIPQLLRLARAGNAVAACIDDMHELGGEDDTLTLAVRVGLAALRETFDQWATPSEFDTVRARLTLEQEALLALPEVLP